MCGAISSYAIFHFWKIRKTTKDRILGREKDKMEY
jgi:hypothetical protein